MAAQVAVCQFQMTQFNSGSFDVIRKYKTNKHTGSHLHIGMTSPGNIKNHVKSSMLSEFFFKITPRLPHIAGGF